MIFIIITAGVFLSDFLIKGYIDKKYARKVSHPKLRGKVSIEKYYNSGASLNLFAKWPGFMKILHTVIMLAVCVAYYFMLRLTGKQLGKVGMALLAGGGLSNLLDRYTKGHVVDYLRFCVGPKWFQRIIFNVSDFFVFIGAALVVIGSEAK